MSLSLCLLGFAVCVITFALAMGGDEKDEPETRTRPLTEGERFFLQTSHPEPAEPKGSGQGILAQLRTHVQSEAEAARAFLDLPNPESLHAPTDSPLWR